MHNLQKYHIADNERTVESLVTLWDNFQLDKNKNELLTEYLTRLESLIAHMAKVKDVDGN